jgi:hypothetical protein
MRLFAVPLRKLRDKRGVRQEFFNLALAECFQGERGVDPKLFEKLSVRILHQRCVVDEFGFIFYRLKDGSGFIQLTQLEWDELGNAFDEAISESSRAVRWAFNLAMPFTILLLILITAVPPLRYAFEAFERVAPLPAYLAVTMTMPVTVFAIHNRLVQRVIEALEQILATQPRCPPPAIRVSKALNVMELIGMVVIGPHLLLQLAGTFDPDIYRNTPLSGTSLGITGYASFGLLVAIGMARWHRTCGGYEADELDTGGRRHDALTRAKSGGA